MHTAICTFEDRAAAQQAADRLAQAGFDRREIHVEHRHADGSPMAQETAAPLERRDHQPVGSFAFFERLFGPNPLAHAETYGGAVERGLYVVLVEGRDEAEAQRAQDVLHGLNPSDFRTVHRAGQRPLRDMLAEHRPGSLEQRFGTARSDMDPSHNMDVRQEGELFPPERTPTGLEAERVESERVPERAMASQGWGEQRVLKVVDDDRPIASPDIPAAHEGDKPR